jgi:hypothetical protein
MNRILFPLLASVLAMAAIPATAQEIDGVSVEIRTGGDDLRGNDDNAFASIWSYRADGRQRGIRRQVNPRDRRIKDHTTTHLYFDTPDGTEADDITLFILNVEGFSGGFDGDNWNVDAIRITGIKDGITVKEYMNEFANPLIRFTGDVHTFSRDLRVR